MSRVADRNFSSKMQTKGTHWRTALEESPHIRATGSEMYTLRKVVAIPEVVERFQALGTYTRDLTPAQTGEFMRSEERLWWPIVRQVNQKR